jgi:pilus assembly protein CpaB
LLAVAVVIGLVAVVLANAYFSGVEQKQKTAAVQQQMARIVVATQPLEFGTRLTEQNVRMQNWPADGVPQGAFRSIPDALKDNRVALRPMVPGEPVLASNVSGLDGRATLAALLPEGMRAFSIPVDQVHGVAGFVLPGTMVDVLLTRQIEGDGATGQDVRSDMLLQNVQVLAIDQLADDKKGEPKVGRTATLAVTPYDAQRLAIALRLGTLSLTLRKVETAEAAAAEGDATGPQARTVTSRQLGMPRIVIGGRRGGGGPVQPANVVMPVAPGMLAQPRIHTGPSMTVVRGTESTSYPVGYLGGR